MYYRVVGSTLAVPVRGHGSSGFPVFLLSENGHDLEACLRERERAGEKQKHKFPLTQSAQGSGMLQRRYLEKGYV